MQRAPGDHRLAGASERGPLPGLLDAVAQDPHHRLKHRVERRSPAPQRGGHHRGCRAVAELDPQDRDPLEHVPGRQISNLLAVTPGVRPGATRRPAGRTDPARLSDKHPEKIRPSVFDRGEVVSQARCEYTTDCLGRAGTGPFGSQTSRPPVRTFPFQIKLRAGKRAAQLNPVRVDSISQFEIETPSELRTE